MSLLEPSKRLDKGQLVWDLLSQFTSPVIEAMKEARLAIMATLSDLLQKRTEAKRARGVKLP